MQYTDIGIDLGTASILVYIRGKGVVLKEPSVVAFDRDTNKIKAIGEDARLMLGRTPGNIVAVRPLRQGVISDYTVTEKMMKYFIQKALGRKTFRRPRIAVCVPSGVTEVEKKAVEDATYQAGAREVSIIEEPIAAAIGAGIDISRPCGNMIVDIGGGTSDIAVISLGGTVVSASIKIAGDDFDEAIVRYMRKKHNLLIGERTAEDIKIKIGSAYKRPEPDYMEVRGRNLVTGLPKTIKVSSENRRGTQRVYNADCRSNSRRIGEDSPGTGCGYRGQRYRPDRRRKPAARSGRADCGAHRHQYDDGRRSDDRSSHRNRQICRISGRIQRVIPSEPERRCKAHRKQEHCQNHNKVAYFMGDLLCSKCLLVWLSARCSLYYNNSGENSGTAERICNTHYLS